MLLLMMLAAAHSQELPHSLSFEANSLLLDTRFQVSHFAFCGQGNSGQDAVWDFSDAKLTGTDEILLAYDSISNSILSISRDGIDRFCQDEQGIYLMGHDTRLRSLSYKQPSARILFPMNYGDSLSFPFDAEGQYCQTIDILSQGVHYVEADGYGAIVMPNGDTLSNVLRIHSQSVAAVEMHEPADTMPDRRRHTKQEISDTYSWYAKGYRFPVFLTRSVAYYDSMNMVSNKQDALCIGVETQKAFPDEVNDSIRNLQTTGAQMTSGNDIIDYTVQYAGNEVIVDFTLTDGASVNVILCNAMGMVFRRLTSYYNEGGHSYSLDCAGMPHDTYILYINVNGAVYSEKVRVY